ncbi:MAG: hypothetical protein JSR36_00555 [Proteobacteria bacterium]|nr:hypothetical protein [Pseudomonadota bacterium]
MQRLSLVLTCALMSACMHEAPIPPAPAPASSPAAPASVAPVPETPAAPPAAAPAPAAPTPAPAETPAPTGPPDVRTPSTPPAKTAQAAPAKAAPPAAAKSASATAAAPAAAAAATPASPSPSAALDLPRLEQRLRDTHAIGVFTKLSLKNQVDDLLARFRTYHQGTTPPTLAQLRQSYELLLIKVISLLQDDDPRLAADVGSSREAIWRVLSDPKKFASLDA